MTDETTPHDNDADSRPRIHIISTSSDGQVEVCVHGSEGESASDIAEIADTRLSKALDGQAELSDRDETADNTGVQ